MTMDERRYFGQPLDRVDGPLKVTGGAPYAFEHRSAGRPLYGHIVGAEIGSGRIVAIDASAAERAPGVQLVMTCRNAPQQAPFGPGAGATGAESRNRFTFARPSLADDRVRFFGEPVALVVADGLEQARAAAALVVVRYERSKGAFDLDVGIPTAYKPALITGERETDTAFGDFEGAMASGPVTLDVEYRTPYQKHNPMEPHAAIASWDGDALTLWTSTQTIGNVRKAVAKTLCMPPDKVRVVSPYVGGGFGSKIAVQAESILAALAAKSLRRPVKIAQTRQQMFATVGHRPEMVHRLRLAATPDGVLTGYGHEVWMQTSRQEEFTEQVCAPGRALYAAPNRLSRHRLVRMDVTPGDTMRAPGEASGLLAVESAMDELACKLDMDPIALRLRNEPTQDPERGVPFSSRDLVGCLREGAKRFGWDRRPAKPGSRREGRQLIGYGVASAIRGSNVRKGAAKVAMAPDGRVTAKLDMTDIGTGSYTILAQVAADELGVAIGDVTVLLGDSAYPENYGSGGSFGAASSAVALHAACAEFRRRLVALAASHAGSPLRGAIASEPEFRAGRLRIGDRSADLGDLVRTVSPGGLEASGSHEGGGQVYKDFSHNSFGAHFAEVAVDADTAEIRVRRMLGVFAAGRIFNAKTAHSQLVGGMIWGIGAALLEEGVLDRRFGHFTNNDLAEYHVAVNADVQAVEAVILDEDDGRANVFGTKGLGELGVCGAGAAVANAVFNATAVRVRSFPITLDKLLNASITGNADGN